MNVLLKCASSSTYRAAVERRTAKVLAKQGADVRHVRLNCWLAGIEHPIGPKLGYGVRQPPDIRSLVSLRWEWNKMKMPRNLGCIGPRNRLSNVLSNGDHNHHNGAWLELIQV